VCVCVCVYLGRRAPCRRKGALQLGLYTIFPSPILYCVWHTEKGSVGGACIAQWLCDGLAIG